MKKPRIVNAVGLIDDDLIIEATKHKEMKKNNLPFKWVSLAACFAVILIAAVAAVPALSGGGNIAPSIDMVNTTFPISNKSTAPAFNNEIVNSPVTAENTNPSVNSENTNPSVNNEYYTNSDDYTESIEPTVNTENTEMFVNEQYGYVKRYFYKVSEGEFSTYDGGRVISEDKVGEKIADVSVTAGWETWGGANLLESVIKETLRAEVYSIDGIPNDTAVALKFIDKGEAVTTTHYYVIMNPDADLTAVEEYVIPRVYYKNFYTIGEE